MTKQIKPVYAADEHPDLGFAQVPHEPGMTYEFDLRTEVAPFLEPFFEKHHKVKSLPRPPGYEPAKHGKIFDFFCKSAGHVFFNLVMKKDGQVLGQRQVGFSTDKNPDAEKRADVKIGVPGFVFDQEKSDPSYHFHKTYPLSREQFENVVKFVEESIKNPPTYHWPVAMNCVRFTKRCAKAAGITESSIMGITNLPISTQAFIGVSQVVDNIEKAAEKIKKTFSNSRTAPVPEQKNEKGNDISKAVINKKQVSR